MVGGGGGGGGGDDAPGSVDFGVVNDLEVLNGLV